MICTVIFVIGCVKTYKMFLELDEEFEEKSLGVLNYTGGYESAQAVTL